MISTTKLLASLLAIVVLLTPPAPVRAQGLPPGMTPQQAAELLQGNPQLQQLLRDRVLGSGISQGDIRQQLGAAGFPPQLLDTFLFGSVGTPQIIDARMLEAIALLGVNAYQPTDFAAYDTTAARLREDALRADSIAGEARAPKGLALFGLEVFRRSTTRFQPMVTGPVDDSYILGPGDVLVLILTGEVQTSEILEVTKEGFVVIARVGQLFVNNLTLGQLREVLYGRLGRAYSGITRGANPKTRFEISVARVRVQTIRVLGEVNRPGSYQVAATGGVLSALYEAGGLKESGNFRAVEVRRGTQLLGTVDLYEYLLRGVVESDIRLQGGDAVFVPVEGPRVKIAGEVRRPAIYELKSGETLRDLVRLAGGLTPIAAIDQATIERVLPPDQRPAPGYARTVLSISLREVLDPTVAPAMLLPADSITVFPVTGGRRGAVTIAGSVWQPGTYALAPGMRLRDLIQAAGGLRPDTYGGRTQILRTRPDSTQQLLGFALDAGSTPDPANDPELHELDRVTIFAATDFRPARYVTLLGAVREPGRVAFADSMTLRDAILLAGGLDESASLAEAELSRLADRSNSGSDSLALILRVPLDSSYVVDQTGYLGRAVGASQAPAVLLHPYDNVFVRRLPGWELQRNVTITGEVQFPGTYTLTTADDRLADVIRRAGGLRTEAYPNGIRFFRAAGEAGRLPVNLPQVLGNPQHRDNLLLVAGDSIHIPRYIPVVRVEGAVNAPASVTYRRGAGLDYYIDAAGGYASRADKKRTFVLQPNGLIEKRARPGAGAVVTVPQKDPSERSKLLELAPLLTGIVQVITATATLIIALSRP